MRRRQNVLLKNQFGSNQLKYWNNSDAVQTIDMVFNRVEISNSRTILINKTFIIHAIICIYQIGLQCTFDGEI